MRRLRGFCLLGLSCLGFSQPGFADTFDMLAGSDYFVTQPGTMFDGIAFEGVPTGPGGSDTIVERASNVFLGFGSGGAGTTPLLLTQLELVSAIPTNLGAGVGFYYITLQSNRPSGGTASTGTMTINLAGGDDRTPAVPEGTFTSALDVFFDVRFGSATGAIVQSTDLVLTNSGASWDANPSPSDTLVPGLKGDVTANFHTNKIQNTDINDMDFFPVSAFSESGPSGDVHTVSDVSTPEPGTLPLLGGALLALLYVRRRVV
jgi:hypothetical protein